MLTFSLIIGTVIKHLSLDCNPNAVTPLIPRLIINFGCLSATSLHAMPKESAFSQISKSVLAELSIMPSYSLFLMEFVI